MNSAVDNIRIPVGVGIRVDDVGWLDGSEGRPYNRPAHSGFPRLHCPDDVRILNEIGKGLGVKLLCNIVLGDWDIKNRLRGVPHMTWDESGWDAASVIGKNRAFFDETFDVLEGSENLEYGLHGLQHAYFENDMLVTTKYLYPHKHKDEQGRTLYEALPEAEFERLLDLFFEIYNDWGFRRPIRVFEAGSGCYGKPEDDFNRALARALRDHGIGIWEWGGWPARVTSLDGMLFLQSVGDGNFLHWNVYGADPRLLKDCFGPDALGHFCPNIVGHLANFIQYQPEKSREYVPGWIDFFRRVISPFGVMLARDNEQSASQSTYASYATVDAVDGGFRIDLAPLDAVRTSLVEDEFFVSIRDKALPRAVTGGVASVHECRADHVIYKIGREPGKTTVTIKM